MKRTIIIISVILVIAVSFVFGIISSFNDHEYFITMTDKERVIENGDSKYLVFGDTDKGVGIVLENTDNLIRGKFNSSDIQGGLKIGKHYKVTVVGYRVPILSWYENIIDIEEC